MGIGNPYTSNGVGGPKAANENPSTRRCIKRDGRYALADDAVAVIDAR
jgi:hypothetical protein